VSLSLTNTKDFGRRSVADLAQFDTHTGWKGPRQATSFSRPEFLIGHSPTAAAGYDGPTEYGRPMALGDFNSPNPTIFALLEEVAPKSGGGWKPRRVNFMSNLFDLRYCSGGGARPPRNLRPRTLPSSRPAGRCQWSLRRGDRSRRRGSITSASPPHVRQTRRGDPLYGGDVATGRKV